jgi:hypothetical protein
VCLVGVWQRNFEPVVCVCVCVRSVELILEINKTVIVASSWSSIFTLPTLMMHGQTQITFISVTLARLRYKLPDDSRRPKHVGTILI